MKQRIQNFEQYIIEARNIKINGVNISNEDELRKVTNKLPVFVKKISFNDYGSGWGNSNYIGLTFEKEYGVGTLKKYAKIFTELMQEEFPGFKPFETIINPILINSGKRDLRKEGFGDFMLVW